MKKLLFLFALILVSCSSNDDDTQIDTYTLSINNPYDRIRIETISLPNHNFSVTSQSKSFQIDKGLNESSDVRIALVSYCSVGGVTDTWNVLVNFYKGQTTTLTVDRIVSCTPNIVVSYQ